MFELPGRQKSLLDLLEICDPCLKKHSLFNRYAVHFNELLDFAADLFQKVSGQTLQSFSPQLAR